MKVNDMNKKVQRLLAVGAVLMTAGVANAAIDTTSITTTIAEVAAAIAVVGAAVTSLHYGKRVWSWIRM